MVEYYPNYERDCEVFRRREAGETFEAIAATYGLRREAVRQAYLKQARRRERLKTDEFAELSVRARNALRSDGYNTRADLEKLRDEDRMRSFSWAPNVGAVTVAEVKRFMGWGK